MPRKFYETIRQIRILTEDEPVSSNYPLAQLADQIIEGDWVGEQTTIRSRELSGPEMAAALYEAGSHHDFFGLTATGEDQYSESGQSDTPEVPSACLEADVLVKKADGTDCRVADLAGGDLLRGHGPDHPLSVLHLPLPVLPDFQLGFYRHYKGNIYEALGLVLKEGDLQLMVRYRRLGANVCWVRPLLEWQEIVAIPGACVLTEENMHTKDDCTLHDHEPVQYVPRFQFIPNQTIQP